MRTPLVYRQSPTVGIDIGSRAVKVMQLGSRAKVVGYGSATFESDMIVEGIIVEPEAMAKVIAGLFANPASGKITARRVVTALPNSKVFTRVLSLPVMDYTDLEQAIRYEAEQYVPVPINDLYIDFQIAGPSTGTEEPHQEVLMVAAPRAVVDSYLKLFELAGLEIGAVETSLDAVVRALLSGNIQKNHTLVVDFGSLAADIAVFNQVIRITSTVAVGGDHLTQALVKNLGIKTDEANEIKYKFGLGPSDLQSKVKKALAPALQLVLREINKIVKYYAEHNDNQQKVEAIVLAGGSANMPGLADFLKAELKMPVTIGDSWQSLNGRLVKAIDKLERPSYAGAIGLALREMP